MATSRYKVVYENGVERHRLLSREDADSLKDSKGVKSVTRDQVSDKQRSPQENK